MSGRTYTLDADMCDTWASRLSGGPATCAADRPMLDAIRAQQPKPRVQWATGLRVRSKADGETYMLTDEKRSRVAVIVADDANGNAGVLVRGLRGVDTDGTLDPNMWEVVA